MPNLVENTLIDMLLRAGAVRRPEDGPVVIVTGEADDSTAPEPEAGTFIKIDGKRAGRDLGLYQLRAKLAGNTDALSDFAQVVISLPQPVKNNLLAIMLAETPPYVLSGQQNAHLAGEWLKLLNSFLFEEETGVKDQVSRS